MAANPSQIKFHQLKTLIEQRQQFERDHPYPPYSTHPTTVNYPDAEGLTLIRYAIRIGDLEQVEELMNQGAWVKNPIRYALGNNKLELATYFFKSNTNFSSIKLADITEEPCRSWFIQKIEESLQASRSNPGVFFLSSHKKSFINLPNRAAEVGDLDFLQACKAKSYFEFDNMMDSLLISASENNQIAVIAFLLSNGARVTPEKSFNEFSLSAAVLAEREEAVVFLLQHNADVNYLGKLKMTALTTAVSSGSLALVNVLLAHGADCLITDVFGRTALHYAAINKRADIASQLLLGLKGQEALAVQDIYGKTPLDYARNNQHDAMLQLLAGGRLHDSNDVPIPPVDIDQSTIMQKMKYYLVSQYRDLGFYNKGGFCNGLSFLRDMYAAKGMETWFYEVLQLIASWDGTQEMLDRAFDEGVPQRAFYNNLGELIEQWSNDIIWFQHSNLERVFDYSLRSKYQENRAFQHAIVGIADQHPVLISNYRERLDNDGFQELIEIFSTRLPVGCRLELSGSAHGTSAYLTSDKKFSYFDPNLPQKTRDFVDAADFTRVVIDTKLIFLGEYKPWGDGTFDSELRFFYYFTPEMQRIMAEHEAFSDNEFPKDRDAVDLFQNASPNQFTPLHVAVLTGSLQTIEKLLAQEDKLCVLRRKDKHKNTAMDIAVSARNIPLMTVLAAGYPDKSAFPLEDMIKRGDIAYAWQEKDTLMLDFFLDHHAKINLESLFFAAINKDNLTMLSSMLKNNMVNVNTPFESSLAIVMAITKADIFMLRLFLKYGAVLTRGIPETTYHNSVLYHIAASPNVLLRILLPSLDDINQPDDYGNSLVHYADRIDFLTGSELVQALELKADFDRLNSADKTALDLVVNKIFLFVSDKIRLSKWLLPKMKINNPNPNFQQTLFELLNMAYDAKDLSFVNEILSRCTMDTINRCTSQGANLLHRAIIDNEIELIQRLCNLGADINIPTKNKGNTGLHLMVLTGNTSFLTQFLENGADTGLENSDGKTVLDLIEESDNDELRSLLSSLVTPSPGM